MRIGFIAASILLLSNPLAYGIAPGPSVPDEERKLEAEILIGINVVASVFSIVDLSTEWDSKLLNVLGLASGIISIEVAGREFQAHSDALMATGVTIVGLSIINLGKTLWGNKITFKPTVMQYPSGLVPAIEVRVSVFD